MKSIKYALWEISTIKTIQNIKKRKLQARWSEIQLHGDIEIEWAERSDLFICSLNIDPQEGIKYYYGFKVAALNKRDKSFCFYVLVLVYLAREIDSNKQIIGSRDIHTYTHTSCMHQLCFTFHQPKVSHVVTPSCKGGREMQFF